MNFLSGVRKKQLLRPGRTSLQLIVREQVTSSSLAFVVPSIKVGWVLLEHIMPGRVRQVISPHSARHLLNTNRLELFVSFTRSQTGQGIKGVEYYRGFPFP